MTVPAVDPFNQHVALGGELTFPYDWITNAEEDLNVFRKQTGLDPVFLVLDVDYTVQGAGNELGGTITPIGAQSPVISGDIWTILRETAVKRASDVPPAGDITPEIFNNQLDYITDFGQDRHHNTLNSLRLHPGVNQTLDQNIPELIDDRALVFREISPGNFEIGLSTVVPGGLQAVVDDPSPQLGGVLDTFGRSIDGSEGAQVVIPGSFIANIWVGDGDTVHITGAVLSDFTAAPRVGAKRTLICDSATLILHLFLGNITIPGGVNFTTEIGDRFDVYADTLTTFTITNYHRASGLSMNRSLSSNWSYGSA